MYRKLKQEVKSGKILYIKFNTDPEKREFLEWYIAKDRDESFDKHLLFKTAKDGVAIQLWWNNTDKSMHYTVYGRESFEMCCEEFENWSDIKSNMKYFNKESSSKLVSIELEGGRIVGTKQTFDKLEKLFMRGIE